MIPKVIFKYSEIYDKILERENTYIQQSQKSREIKLSSKEILNYILNIEEIWKKDEKAILIELSKITFLKWKQEEIFCYIVKNSIPFSDPLTIPIYKKFPDYFIAIVKILYEPRIFLESMT